MINAWGCKTPVNRVGLKNKVTERAYQTMDYDWHIFISHASEDKVAVARPLADHFVRAGLKVWLDETEIKIGDSIREKVDLGLRKSAYGVVIISPHFLAKKWTRAEVDGLFTLETLERKRILPVWHQVGHEDVVAFSPIVAGRLAANTSQGSLSVFQSLVEAMDDEVTSAKDDGWPYHSGRITKRLLMEIPEGYIVVSNSYTPDLRPLFLEALGPLSGREGVWSRFKELRISQSKFYVFKSMKGYRRYVESQQSVYFQ